MGLWGKRSASGKVQKEVTILNKLGLHARPAAMFVRAANKHRAEIWVESVADAGANPTFAAGAIQSAPRSACYEALPLTLWPIVVQDSQKLYAPVSRLTALSAHRVG